MRRVLLLACALLLAGCERRDLPGWWPEALGGEPAPDSFSGGPLDDAPTPGVAPLATLGRDGMRVTVSPSFGAYGFVVDFVPQPAGCYLLDSYEIDEGRLQREGGCGIGVHYWVLGSDATPEPRIRRFEFMVPEEEFRDALIEFNRLAGTWRGTRIAMLDGTDIGIEQFRGGRLRSMRSNAPLSFEPRNPAAHMALHVHRLLLAYGPAGAVPRSSSFTVEQPPSAENACTGYGFAETDPDGFGAGADACARRMAEPRP